MVFHPNRMGRVLVQAPRTDLVMLPSTILQRRAKSALGLVRAGAVLAASLAVVDTHGHELGVQRVTKSAAERARY